MRFPELLSESSKRKNFLVDILAKATLLFTLISVFISSYFNWNLTAIASYLVKDGWCDTAVAGVGNHCFSDYFAPKSIALNSPWDYGPNPNPPLAMNIFRIFSYLSSSTSEQIALSIWIILICISLFIPLLDVQKQKEITSETRFKLLVIYGLSMPVIVSIDRGNILAITVPLMYYYFKALKAKEFSMKTAALLILAALIKPQLIIFSLLLLNNAKIRTFFNVIVIWLSLLFFSFASYGNLMDDLKKYFGILLQYSDYAARGQIYPVNLSIRNTIDIITESFFVSLETETAVTISYLIAFSFALITLMNIKKYSFERCLFNLTLIMISSIGTSFSYYSIFFLLSFIFIWMSKDNLDLFGTRIRFFLVVGVFICMIPINAFSWKLIPFLAEFGQTKVSMTWSFGQVYILIYFLVEMTVETFKLIRRNTIFPRKSEIFRRE